MPNRPAHFEIQYDDLERAKKFYTDVFGWKIMKYDMPGEPYWAIDTGPKEETGLPAGQAGINGGFMKRGGAKPPMGSGMNGYCVTMVVDNYDDVAKKILSAGGMEAMPKFAIPGMAWQGYFMDTEGNTIGLHQADTNAK
jgi:predicted enzyme related to lactoylglutathione lyase